LRAGHSTPLIGNKVYLDHAALSSLTCATASTDQVQEIISQTLVTAFFEAGDDAMAPNCLLPALFCALAVKTPPTAGTPLALHSATRLAQELTCLLNVVKQAGLAAFVLARNTHVLDEMPTWFRATKLMERPVVRALISDICVARKIGSASGQRNVQYAVVQGPDPNSGSNMPRCTIVNGTTICESDFADVAAFVCTLGRSLLYDALEGWPELDGWLRILDKRGPVLFMPPAPWQPPLASYRTDFGGGRQLTGAEVSASLIDWIRVEPGRRQRFLHKMDDFQSLLAAGEVLRLWSACASCLHLPCCLYLPWAPSSLN